MSLPLTQDDAGTAGSLNTDATIGRTSAWGHSEGAHLSQQSLHAGHIGWTRHESLEVKRGTRAQRAIQGEDNAALASGAQLSHVLPIEQTSECTEKNIYIYTQSRV